jgi:hypothetical protein
MTDRFLSVPLDALVPIGHNGEPFVAIGERGEAGDVA